MKSFGQYFKYHFKSTFLRLIIMMAIVLVISLINMGEIVDFRYDYLKVQIMGGISKDAIIGARVRLAFYTTIFAALCTVMPIFELYSFKSRRNLDTLFTLPVSRTKMLFAHLLNGWIHITLAFTGEAAIIFAALLQEKHWVDESYVFGYYFALLGIGLVIYLFFAFIFSQGNTVIDAVVFMIAWIFAFAFPFLVADELFNIRGDLIDDIAYGMICYSPFDIVTSIFMDQMEQYSSVSGYMLEASISCIFWGIIGIISALLLYLTFKKQRVEKVEDISTSPIGYKFLIPYYVISVILWAYDPLIVVIGVIAMLVAYIVYRRTFRIKKWDIIMIAITIVIGIGVGIAQYVIESNSTVEAAAQLCGNVFQHINL